MVELSQARFKALLESLLTQLDDELFDVSARSSRAQVFFDAMRSLRKTRGALMSRSLAHVADAWERCDEPSAQDPEHAPSELSLIDNDILEEGLAIDDAIRHAESRTREELDALRARLAVLCGGIPPENVAVPIAPGVLIASLRLGLGEVDTLATEVKIVIYKHFDRVVLAQAHGIYRALNDAMAQAGILKDWRPAPPPRIVPGQSSAQPSSPGASPDAIPGLESVAPIQRDGQGLPAPEGVRHHPALGYFDAPPGQQPAAMPDSSSMWSLFRLLLGSTRGRAASGPGGAGPGVAPSAGPVASLDDVLSAMAMVRHVRRMAPAAARPQDANWLEASSQIKDDLRAIMASEGGEDAPLPALGPHEDVIDMVSLLFDFVSRDSTLPASMQASLSRLQLPYLRMALVEPELFARPDHPARDLLNALSEAAKGDPFAFDDATNSSVAGEIEAVVGRLATGHDADRARFAAEAAHFRAFMAASARRLSTRERRMTDAEAGRARLANARSTVADLVNPVVDGCDLPEWFNLLLLRPWANALVLWFLRRGEQSPEYQAARQCTLEIPVIAHMPPGAPVRAHLSQRWPAMKATWVAGFREALLPDEEIERWTKAIQRWLAERMQPARLLPPAPEMAPRILDELATKFQPTELSPAEVPAPGVAVPAPVEILSIATSAPPATAGDLPGAAPAGGSPGAAEEPAPAAVLPITVGTWVERLHDGASARIKMVWISPFTRRGLFVNAAGQKNCEIHEDEFDALQRSGTLRVIPDAPLFDRAVGSIVRRLRTQHEE